MKATKSKPCKRVFTKNLHGKINGWLLEIVSQRDGFTENTKGQVYLTVVEPKQLKGFHKHHLKTNHLTCVRGLITIVTWENNHFIEYHVGEDNFLTIKVPPKIPLAIYNRGITDAYIINCCYPAYDPEVEEQEDLDLPWIPTIRS